MSDYGKNGHPQKSNPTSQLIQNPRGIARSNQHLMSVLHNSIYS
jgi:hypothetical protein